MRRSAFFYVFICALCIHMAGVAQPTPQPVNWNVNLNKAWTFTSQNPIDDPGITLSQTWQMDVGAFMANDFYTHGPYYGDYDGINLILNDPTGFAELSIYLYDGTKEDTSRGPLLYHCVARRTSAGPNDFVNDPVEYDFKGWCKWWPKQKANEFPFLFGNTKWRSTDMVTSMFAAVQNNYNNLFSSTKLPGKAFLPSENPNKIPVVIELKIFKANVNSISIPGIGVITADYFRPPVLNMVTDQEQIQPTSVQFKLTIKMPENPATSLPGTVQIYASHLDDPYHVPISSTPYSIPGSAIYNAPNGIYTNQVSLSMIEPLAPGAYQLSAKYTIGTYNSYGNSYTFPQDQFLYNFRVLDPTDQTVYDIPKISYQGLPVFLLSGGMSAEYAVEKSLADLSAGISQTWRVRTVNGQPDLKDGGPVSVYPNQNFDFLGQSVKKTVNLYNTNLGDTTPFETVIIATGVAHVPYLANAMKAPVLPLHFLVSTSSVKEVQKILAGAARDGYSAYANVGYDPSVTDIGVSWIKLRDLPVEYRQFLIDHKVQNVILMGYVPDENTGENGARRIIFEGQDNTAFAEGSIYMMAHGEENTYKLHYKDYGRYKYALEEIIPDWEGGLSDVQRVNFSNSINAITNGPAVYTIQSSGSAEFYRWATDIQLALMKKANIQPTGVHLNEYLIGYPGFELYIGRMPYLYWQGNPAGQTAFFVKEFGQFKTNAFFPQVNYNNLEFFIAAKADRKKILDSLKTYFPQATMDSWQKADVWSAAPNGGSRAYRNAEYIINNIGLNTYTQWCQQRPALTIADLNILVQASAKPAPLPYTQHPGPANVSPILGINELNMNITRYKFNPSEFWHPKNYPNDVEFRKVNKGAQYPGTLIGYLDGQHPQHDIRYQDITIASFNLTNTSDEYDLRMHYKFNIDKELLKSYNPALGEKQNMDCFEFTSVPYNHWMDIPSRVMAKQGALLILNGGVYDFDYNGIPGVVPFIKQDGVIRGQPQILSYKGEGAFAWKWGTSKSAAILSRPKNIPATGLPGSMSQLFRDATSTYPNVMGGMTFMTKNAPYSITNLQPQWMTDYPAFPSYYLKEGQRCFFAPTSLKCSGTEVVAPVNEDWNNCSSLVNDEDVQRFSALAYRQYPKIFDDVPNARTYVGIKGSQLDIGVISGDLGGNGYRGRVPTKTHGMHNYEVSQFCQSKGYDQLVNLDGGSSTQLWLNGRGPLQSINGYPLVDDNQGPYYARLLSSFIMLVPKLHTDQIKQTPSQITGNHEVYLKNDGINWPYSDATDLTKPKAFIDLSPSMDKLNVQNILDGAVMPDGLIAMRFKCSSTKPDPHGAVLFYMGEDMYYPDTKGASIVIPRLRNMMIVGIGAIPPALKDSLFNGMTKGTITAGNGISLDYFKLILNAQPIRFYYIKISEGKVIDFAIDNSSSNLIDGQYHTLTMVKITQSTSRADIDGISLPAFANASAPLFYTGKDITHCYIGAMNLDGRFLTGDANLTFSDVLFIRNFMELHEFGNIGVTNISLKLRQGPGLPNGVNYVYDGVYALEFGEQAGQHVFALAGIQDPRFYGLKLNVLTPPPLMTRNKGINPPGTLLTVNKRKKLF